MTKPLTNLSIRVNIPEEKEYKVKEETVVLWERVIFAGLLLVAIIAGVVALLVWPTDDKAAETLASNPSEPISASLQPPPQLDDSVDGPQAGTQPVLETEADNPTEKSPADKASAEVVVPSAEAVAIAGATVDPKALPVSLSPAPSQAAPTVAVTMDSGAADAAEPVQASVPVVKKTVRDTSTVQPNLAPAADLPRAQVSSHSEHILRAALATALSGREPANNAAAVLHVPKDQLLTVYFFTELDGLRKQAVHYDWFRNEKRVARVKIRPRFDTTGNFSSKYINAQMLGQWRVTAKTAEGELLASASFEVR